MNKMPKIGPTQIKLLERLCNASAVSGDEGEVRRIVLNELMGTSAEIKVDALGNILVTHPGSGKKRLRVMLASHMDEVGFMLVADEEEGLFRFETVGGVDVSQLAGKAVLVGKDHLPGVIGARPIHLTTAEERKQKIPLDALRIDMGLGGGKVSPGDRAVFATRFQRNGQVLFAKALDNRLGVVILLELIRKAPDNIDLLAAFTVQEEIGLRGAKVAAYALKPDLAFIIDATPANDLPSWDGEENALYNTTLGLGPAIYIADGASLNDPRLVRHLHETAQANGIPYQIRQPGSGGTDAGSIHRSRAGVPSVSVSVPHRYSHTAVSIARLEDWKNTFSLLHTALSNLAPDVLSSERK
jgi:putative aminopeptidase FrvX